MLAWFTVPKDRRDYYAWYNGDHRRQMAARRTCIHAVSPGVCGRTFYAASVTDPDMMFWVMLVNAMAFMPTIALSNSVSYSCLAQAGLDPVTAFPPIRVFGTVGFIVAMWAVSLLHLELSSLQLYIASGASLLLSAYALTLPKIPVAEKKRPHRLPASWVWMPSCCLKIHAWPSFSSLP